MLSLPHLVIIFLVALVVLGPEKLPQVARTLGKAMADFRRITSDFRMQIEDEMRDLEREARRRELSAPQPPAPSIAGPSTTEHLPSLEPPEIVPEITIDAAPETPAETVPTEAPGVPAPAEKSPDGQSQPA